MGTFGNYSHYYDLLYKDKDYKVEVQYVIKLLKQHVQERKSILELGCGTGQHAFLFAESGYKVHGIDSSKEMLKRAKERSGEFQVESSCVPSFEHGDIRNYRTENRFDAVVSLFHVMSYQTANQDLQAAFSTARYHLKAGGIFIFDCWYGPAVLSDRPVVRIKRLENEMIKITRIADPVLYPNENCVDVNYHIFILNKETGSVEEVRETHKMRYLFHPEIEIIFKQNGFKCVAAEEFITGRESGFDAWGCCFIGRA